ncbi:hypothetical protein, partial [Streptomyces violascens]|uniref:hypothetical protein n=1 Tax=Streptomyces violascens TaxID=67381 RepID=UPI00368DAC4C
PSQVDGTPPALIHPPERFEHLRREVLQIRPDRSQLPTQHTRSTTQPIKKTRHRLTNLTKHY